MDEKSEYINLIRNLGTKTIESNDKNIDYISFWILLIIILWYTFFSIYYFSNIINHLILNRKSKFFVYWIDYIITSGLSILFVLFYLVFLIFDIFPKIMRNENINREDISFFGNEYNLLKFLRWAPYFSLMLMVYVIIDNILLDIMHNIFLISKMKKIYLIQSDNIKEVYQICKEEKFNDIFYNYFHISSIIVLTIVDLVALCIFGFMITDFKTINLKDIIQTINSGNKFIINIHLYIVVLQFIQFFCLLFIIFVMIFTTYYKKKLVENNFYSNNILIQKIYNSSVEKISFHKDFFTFKTIIDFVINIPLLLYYSLEQLSTFSLIIGGLCIGIYVFFMGAVYLYIEKIHHRTKISNHIKKIFCLKKLNFNFGKREKQKILQGIDLNYSKKEMKIFQELSITNDDYNDESFLFFKSNIQETKNKSLNESLLNSNNKNNQSINTKNQCIDLNKEENYFIIYKLIFLFFLENQRLYQENENLIENSFLIKKINDDNNIINNKELLNEINKINQLSNNIIKDLSNHLIYNSEFLFQSLEEKDYKIQFKLNNNIDENSFLEDKENIFFIKSLFTEKLFQLFPFYQISIKDILKSLNPTLNKKIFSNIIKRKKENDLKEKNNELEKDNFFTYNSLLSFEAYEEEEIKISNIKKFFDSYNSYLMNIIEKKEITFLPLIIGIFHIKFFDNAIIIFLYRNPLFFSQFYKFKHWLNFLINDTEEKIFDSVNQGLLNIKEIEITNNFYLNQLDFNQLNYNLTRDLNFIKNNSLEIYPVINLFIGNEDSEFNSDNFTLESEDNKNIKESFSQIFNSQVFSNNIFKKKKENDSEVFSVLEKKYNCLNQYNYYTIKIFFSNFFRNNCYINITEKNKLSVETYIDYIQSKLYNFLKKN